MEISKTFSRETITLLMKYVDDAALQGIFRNLMYLSQIHEEAATNQNGLQFALALHDLATLANLELHERRHL